MQCIASRSGTLEGTGAPRTNSQTIVRKTTFIEIPKKKGIHIACKNTTLFSHNLLFDPLAVQSIKSGSKQYTISGGRVRDLFPQFVSENSNHTSSNLWLHKWKFFTVLNHHCSHLAVDNRERRKSCWEALAEPILCCQMVSATHNQ